MFSRKGPVLLSHSFEVTEDSFLGLWTSDLVNVYNLDLNIVVHNTLRVRLLNL